MTRITFCIATTEVTELVIAKEAGHVVAPFRLLNLRPAHRTENDRVDALVPALKGPFHGLLARSEIAVPNLSTPEADGVGALRARQLLCIHIISYHVTITVRFGTEPHEWVTL